MKIALVTTIVVGSLLAVSACGSDSTEDDGVGGAAGADTGGTSSGGSSSGGSSSGGTSSGGTAGAAGAAMGGLGGMGGGAPTCEAPEEPAEGELAIAGEYTNTSILGDTSYAIDESVISAESPFGTLASYVLAFDNDEGQILAQNRADNFFGPCLYAVFEWTEVDGDLYVCTSTFDAATPEDALDGPKADASDPAAGGCPQGDMDAPWTLLEPVD